jgi:hypothetical protein
MKQYLLTIYQPDGVTPPPEFLDRVMSDLGAIEDDMRADGAWVFSGGLHQASTATVVRQKGSEVLMTDGPYTESKEHVGGLWIVKAPDLDAALGWAGRIAQATTLPIEVRPFHDEG